MATESGNKRLCLESAASGGYVHVSQISHFLLELRNKVVITLAEKNPDENGEKSGLS